MARSLLPSVLAALLALPGATEAWGQTLPTAPSAVTASRSLRVQIVLMARSRGLAIPAGTDDQVVGFLRARVPDLSVRNVLRGGDRIILDLATLPANLPSVRTGIEAIPTSELGMVVRVDAWSHASESGDAAPASPLVSPSSPDSSPPPPSPIPSSLASPLPDATDTLGRDLPSSGVAFRLERLDSEQFRVVARNVDLDMLLEALADATGMCYVCPSEVGRRRLSIRIDRISEGGLLSVLKSALDLSIRRVGEVNVIAPGPRVP